MKSAFVRQTIAAAALLQLANASISQTCPSADVCYSLNIPDVTASSGTGDIYLQISAPTSYEWVALGQGTQMSGANIFVMYTSSSATNVTVSPRLGTGHVEPSTSGSTAQITVLEGSGVSNGVMTANFRCSNCDSWSGGSMDFTSSGGSWIHAARSGQALNSDDINAQISFHDDHGGFNWDFSAARGGNDINPFLTGQAVSSRTTQSTAAFSRRITHLDIAHGVMAALAWVIFFPTGAIVLRILPSRYTTWVHASIQILGYIIFIAAFGMGVYLATSLSALDHPHAILGIVVFILASLQPLSGLLHHLKFVKTQHRNVWSVFHLTFGRVAIILGIVNGGLGLQWAANASTGQVAAYGVVAAIFGVGFLVASIYGETRRVSNGRAQRLQSDSREK